MKTFDIVVIISLFVAVKASFEEEGKDFEGDILLTPDQGILIDKGIDLNLADSVKRGASKFRRWPEGVVSYTIDKSLSGQSRAKSVIASAMKEWSEKTCIKFKPRQKETAYVNFQLGSGCSSYVGRIGREQPINLASGCWHHGVVIHEIGHALGLWHEQSRPDRDDYVTIMWGNIIEKNKHNFKIHGDSSIDSLGVPYDYGSIMHYGSRYFSKNGQDTIKPKNGQSIGQRQGLSNLDAKQMNLMYQCNGGPSTIAPSSAAPSTAAPTSSSPTSPGTCKDTWRKCSKFAHKCNSWKKMHKRCRKTCNQCGPTAPTTAPPAACRDTWSQCAKNKSKCKTKKKMQRRCKKTCNLC